MVFNSHLISITPVAIKHDRLPFGLFDVRQPEFCDCLPNLDIFVLQTTCCNSNLKREGTEM